MNELEIVTEAARLLAPEGKTSIEYLTAEFSPFSDQFCPDLIFLPRSNPGALFFVEFRAKTATKSLSGGELLKRLLAHKEFVSAPPNSVTAYAFASDSSLDESVIGSLNQHQIEFLGPIDCGAELARHVREWTDRSLRRPATHSATHPSE